ncbi:hypothetical protein Tco_0153421 [Tanacetum coccineum]
MALGYQNPFYLKQAQQKQQSLYNGRVLLKKHDPPAVYNLEEPLQLAQESRLKMKQLNKEIKPANYAKINKLFEVLFLKRPSHEKRLNADINKWSSPAYQEFHKIIKNEIAPIVNQVDTRVQNFETHFVKEAAKFVQDFKSLVKEANEFLDKILVLEKENERLLRAVVSQHIMSIVQSPSVVETLKLQTELELKGTSVNTKFAKPSILGKPPSSSGSKLYFVTPFLKTLSKPAISHSVPKSQESIIVQNDKMIAPGIFRTNPLKNYRVDNFVPNKHVKASVRTKPITISQPRVITKKDVNSNTNGLPSTGVESNAKTRRPQHRSNPNNDSIPYASKSICLSNNLEKVEEHHKNLQFSKTPNHRSSEGNNVKLAIRNEKYEVVCATCKQCLITSNHDECVFKYVNDMNSRKKNQIANVSESANKKKHKPNVKKSKKLGFEESFEERLASPRPSKPRTCLRWLLTRRIFDLCGKITASSNTESESETSVCDNASASNPQEPTSKGFLNSTSFLGRFTRLRRQTTCIHPLAVL